MLSGIRRGRKKEKKKKQGGREARAGTGAEDGAPRSVQNAAASQNASVADRLRRSLVSKDTTALSEPSVTAALAATASYNCRPDQERKKRSEPPAVDSLEHRGRIQRALASNEKTEQKKSGGDPDDDSDGPVVFHLGSSSNKKSEEDMTVNELAAEERRQTEKGVSWDEHMTRNLVRTGRKRRRKIGKDDDSDDEVNRMVKLLPGEVARKPAGADSNRPPTARQIRQEAKAKQREEHRAVAQYHKQEKATSKCPWWMESSSFAKHRLVALGDHVSLVMAPPNASLDVGNHFYLVPVKYAESFTACDVSVWDEVRRFLNSLKRLYAKDGKGVVFLETVMPDQKGLWQTKLDVVPIPNDTLQDAPIFFKQAMLDQTEDWGTHNKIMPTSPSKPLIHVVPKNFPYFYVEWGNVSTSPSTGFAQIIESSGFRHDFGLDTLASMMELDPIRFSRKRRFDPQQERSHISEFLEKWKDYDWTLQLDG